MIPLDLHPDWLALALALGAWVLRRLLRGETQPEAQGHACLPETAHSVSTAPGTPSARNTGRFDAARGRNN